MSGLALFLGFATGWVVIICGLIYLIRRLTAPPRHLGKCCREVPCGRTCAEWHQKARDRLDIQYDKIVHELGTLVTAGNRQLDAAAPAPGPGPGY